MTNKSEASYRHVFLYINEHVFDMTCNSFMTDYELAMRNALRFVYPNAQFFACWFHFCQASRKKASMLRILPEISGEQQLRRMYYKFLCIPLLPSDKILEGFRLLSLEARAVNAVLFADFLTYFENQWLTRVSTFLFKVALCVDQFKSI